MNEFLQSAGSGLDLPGADASGDALEGVREAFGKSRVTPGKRARDLLRRRTLLFNELTQKS